MAQYYSEPKTDQSLWEIVRTALIIFQNAAVLEVYILNLVAFCCAMYFFLQISTRRNMTFEKFIVSFFSWN